MKVKELIEKLQEINDKDVEVVISDPEGYKMSTEYLELVVDGNRLILDVS